ncbi:reverse transcriptase domain-containing protein [Tanacetum coccineum]
MKCGLSDGNKEVHKALNTNDLGSFPSLSESCGSPISLTTKISAIEKQMIDGKLVLVEDDSLPLKPTHMEHSSSPRRFILEKENGTDVVVESVVQIDPTSFASVVNDKSVNQKVNFRSFDSGKPPNDMAEVQISLSSVLEAQFRGVTMMNLKGLFFKFYSIEGMNGVLENGSWFIRSIPIILMKWTPNARPIECWLLDLVILMLDSYTSTMCMQSWERLNYARALIDIRVGLRKNMIIAIPNLEGEGEVLYTVRIKYECKSPRCGMCKVFGHDDMTCPHRVVEVPKKQSKNTNVFQQQPKRAFRCLNLVSKIQFKLTKQVDQPVSKKNGASSSGIKKQDETTTQEASTSNPTSNVASKNVDDPVNAYNDNEVKEVYDETASFMAQAISKINNTSKNGSGVKNSSLYERWKKTYDDNLYDDDEFNDYGLTDAQMAFANAFDISLRAQILYT